MRLIFRFALAAMLHLTMLAPARAEPTGYMNDQETFSFSASCASGQATCLWPMSQTDIIYWAGPQICRVWSESGGRHCVDSYGKFTYGTDPYKLADMDVAARQAIENETAPSQLNYKTIGRSNCTLTNSGSWLLSCDYDKARKTTNAQGQIEWLPDLISGKGQLKISQAPVDGGRTRPCDGRLPGIGCPTAAADRTFDNAMGTCSDPLGASLVPMCLQYPQAGNPISILSGAKVENRSDLAGPIPFLRWYSSNNHPAYGMSTWRHNHESYMAFDNANPAPPAQPYPSSINFRLEDGSDVAFYRAGPSAPFAAIGDDQKHFKAEANAQGFLLTLPSGERRQYGPTGFMLSRTWRSGYAWTYGYAPNGRVNSVVDSYGRGLSIAYNGSGFLASVSTTGVSQTDQMTYGYQNGRLAWASFNGGEAESYGYNAAGKLDSITDALGATYARFVYDAATGKATGSYHVVGGQPTEQVSVAYGANQITVTARGAASVYQTTRDSYTAIRRVTSASIAGGASTYSVGYQGVATAFSEGNQSTSHTLNSTTYLPSRTQAAGGTTNYVWDASTRLLTSATQDSATGYGARKTEYAYDGLGNVLSVTVSSQASGSRTWTATYGTFGKVLTSAGPDGAQTVNEYYEDDHSIPELRGQLKSTTNALGHQTHFGYDSRGRLNSITDPNGVETTVVLDARGRTLSMSRAGATSSATYDAAGQLQTMSSSSGMSLTYGYDEAHRLISIASSTGDSLSYAYDADGNRTQDSASQNGALARVANRQFDALGRLKSSWGEDPLEKSTLTYDAQSRPKSVVDGLGRASSTDYDRLGNPTMIRGPGSTASNGYAQRIQRDPDGNPTYYSPDHWGATTFTWNDFGEMLSMISPDSGNQTLTHDPVARVQTMADALGVTHSATSDALGRPLQTTHAKAGATTIVETYAYDAPGAKGMLESVQDASGSTAWTWSERGQPLTRTQTVDNVTLSIAYGYSSDGRLESMTYPSGMVVAYGWDQGRISSVSVNGQTLLSNIGYAPFSSEPISWTWASGGSRQKTFDASGKITGVSDTGVMEQSTVFDAGMRLTSLNDGAFSLTASYLQGDQLSGLVVNGQTQNYTFNSVLSRTSRKNFDGSTDTFNGGVRSGQQWWSTPAGGGAQTYKPTLTYDARRSMTSNGRSTLTYDLRGDLATSLTAGVSASYAYNAFHQRVKKTVGVESTLFAYDDAGNLAGEYSASGAPLQEHVYLGSLPVGVVAAAQTYAVHADYLGTPRAVTSGSTIVWKWDNADPFGKNPPSIQTLVYNPRFPGQYYDAESGLHYNHHRTYDPELGRYVQSDPLGVDAGPDTVSYVNHSPLNGNDPFGLASVLYVQDVNGAPHILFGVGPQGNEIFYNLTLNDGQKFLNESPNFFGYDLNPIKRLAYMGKGYMYSLMDSPKSTLRSFIQPMTRKDLHDRYLKNNTEGNISIYEASFQSSSQEDDIAASHVLNKIHGTAYGLGENSIHGTTSNCTTSVELSLSAAMPDFPKNESKSGNYLNRPIDLFYGIINSNFASKRNLKVTQWKRQK